MVARAYTVAFEGVETRIVEVQCAVAPGLPAFSLVGLPDKAVSEAKERVRAALTGRGVVVGTVSAAAFGVVTPFCSCSAVPLFIGFLQAGIPVGVTLAFLISSPLVNEVALVLLWGLFGWEVAVIYMVAGLSVAIPSLMFHRYFSGQVDRLVVGMEEQALKMVEVMQGERETGTDTDTD